MTEVVILIAFMFVIACGSAFIIVAAIAAYTE